MLMYLLAGVFAAAIDPNITQEEEKDDSNVARGGIPYNKPPYIPNVENTPVHIPYPLPYPMEGIINYSIWQINN